MKIYVASSWRNEHQQGVVDLLRDAGNTIYDFKNPEAGNHGFHWEEIDPQWQQWTPEQYMNALEHPVAERGFGKDFEAMRWADACVVVMPCGRSAHLEAGWFCGQGKRCLFYYPDGVMVEPELMVKMARGIVRGEQALLRATGCSLCGQVKEIGQLFCGAACSQRWECGERP